MVHIIYGGTGGIGAALAGRLSLAGRKVHLVARDAARLAAIATDLDATYTSGDVADPELFARVAADVPGPVEGLAYVVGSITLKPVTRITQADILADFRLNALGAFLAVQAALPGLKAAAEGASVVLFSSVAVGQGFTNHASIALAKGAVEGLVRSAAAELAPQVRVNGVAPSLTRTPLARGLTANEQMAGAIAGMHALQRLGEPDDIAATAAFLLSPDAGWITGQIIGVDGGRSRLRTKG